MGWPCFLVLSGAQCALMLLQDHRPSHVHVSLQDRVKPEAIEKLKNIRMDVEFQMNAELRLSTASSDVASYLLVWYVCLMV